MPREPTADLRHPEEHHETMSEYDLPELPSDEELGIEGIELDDEGEPAPAEAAAAPTEAAGRRGGDGGDGGKAAPDRPPRRWRGPLTLAVLVAMAWLARPGWSLPDPVPPTAPDTAFSSGRAMVRLVDLARRPHPPGSPEHARIRNDLLESLEELGLVPEVQTTTSLVRQGRTIRAATVRNVLARIPGTDPTGAVLATAHYDGRGISPSAGDDASGVAAILEAVRAVGAGEPLRNDVIVLLTDGEELGLLGARAFVAGHRWMQDVSVVLSVEMRGGGGPSIMFETGPGNGWVVEALKAGDPRPIANSLSYEVYRRLPNDTDFTPFREAGVQGLNFAGIGRPSVYHQTFDTPATFQEATLQHHGVHLTGMLHELGRRDLTDVDAPDRVFFRLPLLGLVTYGTLWVPVLGIVLFLAAAATVVLGRRRGASVASMAVGLLLALAAGAGTAAAGWALFRQVRSRHAEYGFLQGSAFHSEGWYVLAAAAIAFALVTGLFGVARRRASLVGLSTGALVPPVLAALFLTFAAPLAAMNLQWPALAGVAGATLVAGTAGPRPPGLLRQALLLLPAAVVVAFLVPLVELLWLAMNVSLLPVLGALLVLALLMLLPFLDAFAEPNRWWAPVLGVALAAGFTGMGLLGARPSAERPVPSDLAWTLDRETGEARWVTRPGPGLGWARERVGALDAEGDLTAFGVGPGRVLTAPATHVEVEALEASTVEGEPGTTRVALRSGAGAEMLLVRADSASPVRWRAVNGRPVGSGPPADAVVHWGEPEEGHVLLDLEAAPGADSVALVVVEHHLRPAELVGEEPFLRPPGLVPATDWIGERALIRTVVRLPVTPGSP